MEVVSRTLPSPTAPKSRTLKTFSSRVRAQEQAGIANKATSKTTVTNTYQNELRKPEAITRIGVILMDGSRPDQRLEPETCNLKSRHRAHIPSAATDRGTPS